MSALAAQPNSRPSEAMIWASILSVLGRNRHVEFTLDDQVPLNQLKMELRGYLSASKERFRGGKVALNLGGRLLAIGEIEELKNILKDEFDLSLVGLWCGENLLNALLHDRPDLNDPPLQVPIQEPNHRLVDQETLLLRGTCRSGMTIYNAGNVVVIGDVNPGAEITAKGDILVFGRLRGIAHAGMGRDDNATVIALSLEADQIRIGPHIYIDPNPRSKKQSKKLPSRVMIKEGRISIEPYVPRSIGTYER